MYRVGPLFDNSAEENNRMIEHCGYDALLFVEFQRCMLFLFIACGFYGVCVLIPCNYSASSTSTNSSQENTTINDNFIFGLDELTISNIPQGDSRLWLHFLSGYIYSFFTFYFLLKFNAAFAQFRVRFFQSAKTNKTILVRGLPKGTTSAALREKFDSLYGDVVAAYVVMDLRKLDDALVRRKEVPVPSLTPLL